MREVSGDRVGLYYHVLVRQLGEERVFSYVFEIPRVSDVNGERLEGRERTLALQMGLAESMAYRLGSTAEEQWGRAVYLFNQAAANGRNRLRLSRKSA